MSAFTRSDHYNAREALLAVQQAIEELDTIRRRMRASESRLVSILERHRSSQ